LPEGCSVTSAEIIWKFDDIKKSNSNSVSISPITNTLSNKENIDKKRKSSETANETSSTSILKKAKPTLNRPKTINEIKKLKKIVKDFEDSFSKDNTREDKENNEKIENEIAKLDRLIKKWRIGCQNAITELHNVVSESEPASISSIVSQLGIDPKLLKFNAENEDFEEQ